MQVDLTEVKRSPTYEDLLAAGLEDQMRLSAPPSKTFWMTRDKRQILIKDMDDSHLVNALRFIVRNCEAYRAARIAQLQEAESSGWQMLSMLQWM